MISIMDDDLSNFRCPKVSPLRLASNLPKFRNLSPIYIYIGVIWVHKLNPASIYVVWILSMSNTESISYFWNLEGKNKNEGWR